jgi:hypothetical protein
MSLKGNLGDLSVPDLLQIPLIGGLTGSLSFSNGDQEATVFYDKGAIVHGECGDVQGEQVIYDLLEWTEGKFSFEKGRKNPAATVKKDVQHLLLEGLRRLDERAKVEAEQQQLLRAQLGDPEALSLVLSEGMAGASMVIGMACLWDREGRVLASWPGATTPGSAEHEKLGMCLKMWKAAGRGWNQLYWASEEGWVAAWNVESLCVLAAIANERAGLGQFHFAFKKAADTIVQRIRGTSTPATAQGATGRA